MYKILTKCGFVIALIAICFSFPSCVSYKNVPYFQDLDSTKVIDLMKYKAPLVQKSSVLSIKITSLSAESQVLFGDAMTETRVPNSSNSNNTNLQYTGFLVDEKGEIDLPTLGKIKVEGLTTAQVKDILVEKASYYVKNPAVTVRFLNFTVSVTGEVGHAGTYPITNERVTVIEAIAMAGDLKTTGKRENVLVIRQNGDQVSFARLDLRSKKVFESPYFYLANNDVVYVEPNIQRLERNDNIYQNTTIALSVLTALSLILSRLNN